VAGHLQYRLGPFKVALVAGGGGAVGWTEILVAGPKFWETDSGHGTLRPVGPFDLQVVFEMLVESAGCS
jgi:hypothetical protein